MMRMVPLLLALALSASAGSMKLVAKSETETDELLEKNRPVSKVINLLKDIVAQLEKEGEEDQEVYEQMGCWCTTNDKTKTQEIASGNDRLNELTHAIEDMTANSARLSAELGIAKKEVAENEEALSGATELREKQLAEFTAEEKDMVTSITSLKAAVVALSKSQGAASFLQESSQVTRASTLLQAAHQIKRHGVFLANVATPDQQQLVEAFLQARAGAQGQFQALAQETQSGQIFGILKAMKESFETNLANSQKEEVANNDAYEDLKKAKEAEIASGKEMINTKTQELATTDEKNAESKQDLEDTRNTLAANTEYLANLQGQCQNIDHEYEARTENRQLEIGATSKALQFLSSDEAHDLFSRTFNFVQTGSGLHSAKLAKVATMLSSAAHRSGDTRLLGLASRSRMDAFGKVRKQIQDVVDSLTREKEEEIKKKDYCIDRITEIDQADKVNEKRNKADAIAAIDDLKMDRDRLTIELAELKTAIADAEAELKKAGVDREKANQEFLVVVADQRATQKLLAAALNILKGFYDKAALLQVQSEALQPAGPPPPPGFKAAEPNAASGGVMGMMQSIIDDAKNMEHEAVRSEKDSQEEYTSLVQETQTSIDAMNKDITNKNEAKAKTEADQVERQKELDEALDALEENEKASKDIHYECDFLLKNFEARQSARDDEISSLKEALGVFAESNFAAFLQFQP